MNNGPIEHLTCFLNGDPMPPGVECMADRIPGGFFIYRENEQQEILYVNQILLKIFGCRTIEEFRELTGCSFRGIVHPEDYETVQKSIEEQIADKKNEGAA